MTGPIHFDELTWPEVTALPREIPLVLPLGERFDSDAIGDALGAANWGLLPALPYGWSESPVKVDPRLFARFTAGVFESLIEDGFQHLTLLSAEALDFDLPGVRSLQIPPERALQPLPALGSDRVVLIPTGHTEQHAYHLPLNTDTQIIAAITADVAHAVPDLALALPVLPYGVSTHRRSFAGTFNVGGRVYEDFLLGVIEALASAGADRIYLINGHGGNHSFLVNVVKFAGERFPAVFTATSWLHTSGAIGSAALERFRRSGRGGMGHAGELETAMMLHLRPELVHIERVVDEIDFIASEMYFMDWIEGGELIANPPWEDDTRTGAYGAGSLATAENGRLWLDAAIEEKIAHVQAIHEQQNRRLARRSG
jgi:creatinine amidohydrolase